MSRSTLFHPMHRSWSPCSPPAPLATGAMLVGGAATSGANAAEVQTWERLANCESGQRWHINTGNGYFGGLQFSDSTWDAYNGPPDEGPRRQRAARRRRS